MYVLGRPTPQPTELVGLAYTEDTGWSLDKGHRAKHQNHRAINDQIQDRLCTAGVSQRFGMNVLNLEF